MSKSGLERRLDELEAKEEAVSDGSAGRRAEIERLLALFPILFPKGGEQVLKQDHERIMEELRELEALGPHEPGLDRLLRRFAFLFPDEDAVREVDDGE